jgi:hypothetical protein
VNERGQPVEDAAVMAIQVGTNDRSGALSQRSVQSDRDGNFLIDALPPAPYTLRVSVPGYVAAAGSLDEGGRPRHFRPGDWPTISLTLGGVITGTVTDINGDPLAALRIKATRIKDTEGRTVPIRVINVDQLLLFAEFRTDDRGIYRIWGLEPGIYVVSASTAGLIPFPIDVFGSGAPVFHPSGGREGAAEVSLAAGQEVSGVDIRFREASGHSISGSAMTSVVSAGFGDMGVVALSRVGSTVMESMTFALPQEGALRFSFNGVADGDYNLVAMNGGADGSAAISAPRRVTVKGADVRGVDLLLSPLASLSGRVVAEPAPEAIKGLCKSIGGPLQETVVAAQSNQRDKLPNDGLVGLLLGMSLETAPDEQGEFQLRSVPAGSYHLRVTPPGDYYFVRSITLTGASRSSDEPGKRGLVIQPGEKRSGLTVTLAPGAASFSGRVVPESEKTPLPRDLIVHLIPAEPDQADNTLRYFESAADNRDSKFMLSNVAPGRYWILVREQQSASEEPIARPLAWDRKAREGLRADAQAVNQSIELQPCQKVVDVKARFKPSTTKPASLPKQ